MKKIILCMALSVACLFGGIASFLANDVTAYAGWARRNYPYMADEFGRHMNRFFPGCMPQERRYGEGRHHRGRPAPPPAYERPAPGPAPQGAPAPAAPPADSPQPAPSAPPAVNP